MKRFNFLLSTILLSSAVLFVACEDENMSDESSVDLEEIIGKYEGILTVSDISGNSNNESSRTAVADVDITGDGQVNVHCYGEGIDTTFMLNVYAHNDSAMVCFSGQVFEAEYGHMMGQGHMMHGNISSGTDWMHHLDDEHQDEDEHFGGFDMNMHSFTCDFGIMENDTLRNAHFNGSK